MQESDILKVHNVKVTSDFLTVLASDLVQF